MDPQNLSGITVEDLLVDESDFSEVSSVGTNLKQLLKKIKSLEAKLAKNEQQANAAESSTSGSSFQIGMQLGKIENQMEVMKKEMDGLRLEAAGLKGAKHVGIGAFEEMKKEVEKFGQEKEDLKKKIDGMNAEKEEGKLAFDGLKREVLKFGQENEDLKKDLDGNKKKLEEVEKEMAELKEVNRKLKEQIGTKNGEFDGQIVDLKEANVKLGQEFGEKLVLKADKEELDNLGQRVNGLEEETRFKLDLIDLKENKWNPLDRGLKLTISEGGRLVKHSGPNAYNCVRAQMSIPKFNSNAHKSAISYFEVEIVANLPNSNYIRIGFCTQQFPLEGNWLGKVQNSIGIGNKGGIDIDGKFENFGNAGDSFATVEIIGIGIVHFQAIMKCFATCNGNLLGWAALCQKFAALQLFPAVTMFYPNDSIRANFGTEPWRCNPLEIVEMLN